MGECVDVLAEVHPMYNKDGIKEKLTITSLLVFSQIFQKYIKDVYVTKFMTFFFFENRFLKY